MEQGPCLWMFWESRWLIHLRISMIYHSQYFAIHSRISEWDHTSKIPYPYHESGTDGSYYTLYNWRIDVYRSRVRSTSISMLSIGMCQDHTDTVMRSTDLPLARNHDPLPTLLRRSLQWIWKPPRWESSSILDGQVWRTGEHTLWHWWISASSRCDLTSYPESLSTIMCTADTTLSATKRCGNNIWKWLWLVEQEKTRQGHMRNIWWGWLEHR